LGEVSGQLPGSSPRLSYFPALAHYVPSAKKSNLLAMSHFAAFGIPKFTTEIIEH
jgi:hypothetical protein